MTSNHAIKAIVGNYWHSRAEDYDDAAQHVADDPAFHRRWLQLLRANVAADGPQDVLDVGCGTGFMALLWAELGHRVLGVDQSEAMLAVAQRKATQRGLGLSVRRGDADALDIADASLDVVAERHVLWTMLDPAATLAEWHRVLRPGGVIVHVGGDWSTLDAGSDVTRDPYRSIAQQLPLMGGAPAGRVLPLFERAGFVDLVVTELDEATYWQAADPEHPTRRYVIRGCRPA
ncbi:MAG: methyltransferase domain-containing protein [Arachnia sp.]